MISALLDHPWHLAENIIGSPRGQGVLRTFHNLLKTRGITPVPFLDQAEVNSLWPHLKKHGITGDAVGQLIGLAQPYVRHRSGECTATVVDGPADLNPVWRQALRDGMQDAADSRSPQILYASTERNRWGTAIEVNVRLEACGADAASDGYSRCLVELGGYDEHPYASIDCDPWRTFVWRNRPQSTGGSQTPCILPKPARVHAVRMEQLEDTLRQARSDPWDLGGRYVFMPPADWKSKSGTSGGWRDGRAFRCETAPGSEHRGPIDYESRVWEWDITKRHWDVQLLSGKHHRVSHEGEWLDAPRLR